MAKKQVEELPKITNTLFADAPDKTKVKFAGILKSIEPKETPTGTAMRFKGDFAMEIGDETLRSKYAFFPAAVREPLQAAINKAAPKWDSLEFVFLAEKTITPTNSTWAVSFSILPRLEQPRVLALLA